MERYSQRDPRWQHVFIGDSKSTIGAYGCLVTAISMMADAPSPVVGMQKLHTAGLLGSPRGKAYLNNFDVSKAFPDWKLVYVSRRWSYPVPKLDLQRLFEHIANGHPALIEVDLDRGTPGLNQHFVLGVETVGYENIKIYDPWRYPNVETLLCPLYGSKPSIAVWRYILYEKAKEN